MTTVARSAIPETTKVHSSGMGKKTENETAISEITMSRIMTRISLFFIAKSNHGAPRVVQSAATLGVEDQLVLIVFIPEEYEPLGNLNWASFLGLLPRGSQISRIT
jgi:hypothetical protein